VIALAPRTGDRRRYRGRVEALLERIRDETQRLQLLKVAGVRGSLLAERVRELERTREELAALVASRQ
jgi:hypothetical protein